MPDLKIVVCLKVVPKSEEVSVNAETNTLERGNARSEINGADMNALQVALEIKDTHGGSVTVLSMGPPFAERYLRLAMAMGADAAYLMSDRALEALTPFPRHTRWLKASAPWRNAISSSAARNRLTGPRARCPRELRNGWTCRR
jgi:hypothetical protein